MKIRHILPGYGLLPQNLEQGSASGLVGIAYQIGRQQAVQGDEVEVYGMGQTGVISGKHEPLTDRFTLQIIEQWKWAKLGPYDYRVLAPLTRKLNAGGEADAHHVHINPFHLHPGKAKVRVIHFHNEPTNPPPPSYAAAIRHKTNAVFCCSTFVRGRFRAALPDYPEDRIFIMPNGIDLERFQPGKREEYRRHYNIQPGEWVVSFAGQVNEEKGLIYLVEALKKVPDLPIRLLVAGSSTIWGGPGSDAGNALSPYEKRVMEAAQGLKVDFLGKVSYGQMPAVYGASDVFVCPSVWDEPLGMVNVEAMAMGVPVIGAQSGGIPDIVFHDETGFLVPRADAEAIAAKLRVLYENKDLYQKFHAASLVRCREFDWNIIANRCRDIYRQFMP